VLLLVVLAGVEELAAGVLDDKRDRILIEPLFDVANRPALARTERLRAVVATGIYAPTSATIAARHADLCVCVPSESSGEP
jgi:hypothetical protein